MPTESQAIPDDFDAFIKRWPLIVINSDSPQEALAFLPRQLPYLLGHLPPELTRFAYELHAASRYVTHRPPSWCPVRVLDRSRAAPFRFYETLEQQLAWAAYNFLQPLVGFRSVYGCVMASGPHLALRKSTLHNCIVSFVIAIVSLHMTLRSFAVNLYGLRGRPLVENCSPCLRRFISGVSLPRALPANIRSRHTLSSAGSGPIRRTTFRLNGC